MMKTKLAVLTIAVLLFGALCATDEGPGETLFSTTQEPREAKMPEMLMAGFQVMNTMEHEAMMKVWGSFMSVVEKLPCDPAAPYYGVTFFTEDYNPQEDTGYGYMAGVPVLSTEGLPEGVVLRKIPARDYIVFDHTGPLKYLEESYKYIFYKYMPQGKYTGIYADVLEVYDCRFSEDSPDSVIEIWIPVEARQ